MALKKWKLKILLLVLLGLSITFSIYGFYNSNPKFWILGGAFCQWAIAITIFLKEKNIKKSTVFFCFGLFSFIAGAVIF